MHAVVTETPQERMLPSESVDTTIILWPELTPAEKQRLEAWGGSIMDSVSKWGTDIRLWVEAGSGIIVIESSLADLIAYPRSNVLTAGAIGAIAWSVLGREGPPNLYIGNSAIRDPEGLAFGKRPRRAILSVAWNALRERAAAVGCSIPVADPESLTPADLIEAIHALERAIVRAARVQGGTAWPSQHAS